MSGINIHVGTPRRITASVRTAAPAPTERQVVFAVRSEFPAVGSPETLYIATDEENVYYYAAGTGYVIVGGGDVTKAYVDAQADRKVDKVVGKGLSTEDYTTAEKAKLGGIAAGASANTVIDTSCILAAESWAGASAPYTQTVNVSGILERDKPILDVSISSNVATGISEAEQWEYITQAVTGAGTITFSCYETRPDIDLTVNVKVVR